MTFEWKDQDDETLIRLVRQGKPLDYVVKTLGASRDCVLDRMRYMLDVEQRYAQLGDMIRKWYS